MFYLRTLGTLSLHADGSETPPLPTGQKPLLILAVLAVAAGHRLRRDHVADLLWPDAPKKSRLGSLRQSLYEIARATGGGCVVSEDGHLALDPAFDCDLWRFDRAFQEGDFEAALDLVDGRFLEGYGTLRGELHDWIEVQNERLRAALRICHEGLIGRHVEDGDDRRAVDVARAYASSAPLDEEAHKLLVGLLIRVGSDAEALTAYEEYRARIGSAVGDTPTPELEEAVSAVRAVLFADKDWRSLAPEKAAIATRSGRGTLIGAAVVMIIGLSLVPLLAKSATRPAPNTRISNLSARFLITHSEDSTRLYEARVDGQRVSLSPTEFPARAWPSPDGTLYAIQRSTPGGYDVEIVALESGETVETLDAPGDEKVRGWSPKGRRLLYWYGEVAEDGEYSADLVSLDVDSGLKRILASDGSGDRSAMWSPTGFTLAYVREDGTVAAIDLTSDIPVERTLAADGEVLSWSPSGRQLALFGNQKAPPNVRVVELERPEPALRIALSSRPNSALWLSDRILVLQISRDDGNQMLAYDVESGESTALGGATRNIGAILSTWPRDATTGSEDLRIIAPAEVLRGERFVPQAQAVDASVPGQTIALRPAWTADPDSILEVLGDTLVARYPGRVVLRATLGGRPLGERRITVRALRASSLHPVLVEAWTGGIEPDVWTVSGSPAPEVIATGGRDGGPYLVSNGDQNFSSGLISRRAFDLRDGITVELEAYAELSGLHFQGLELHLLSGRDTPGDERVFVHQIAGFKLNGRDRAIHLLGPGQAVWRDIDFPTTTWRNYTLQIDATGLTVVLVDGRAILTRRLDPATLPPAAYIAVGGRSLNGDIRHGAVTVYEGVRYR